jgi:hypothetical protein
MIMRAESTVRWVWAGVVVLTAAISALAVAGAAGLISVALARQLVGIGLGLMTLHVGNLLPKLRPFRGMAGNTASIERLSGWILTLVGIAWVVLFALAPVQQARPVAALIGGCAVLVLAARWAVLALATWSTQGRPEAGELAASGYASDRWHPIGWLLFAFFYVLVVACVKFLVEEKQLATELSMWILGGFWLLYAALSAALGRRQGLC